MTASARATNRVVLLCVLLITVLAFAMRAYRLAEVPAGFYCDEAANGYNAHRIFAEGVDEHGKPYPLFFWSFLAFKYPLYVYPSAVWTGLFGLSELSSRFQAAVYGAATVPVAFAIARLFAGNAAGLAAALLLAIIPWHFHFSRVGFSLIGLPFWFGLGFLFLARALGAAARRRDWALAGLFLALTPYSYAPAQVFVPPFVALALLLHADVVWRRRRWAALGGATGLLVAAPFVHFFWENLELQTRYAEMISVFTPGRTTWGALRLAGENWLTYYGTHFLFVRGDPNVRHGVRIAGELYWAMAPWVGAGIAASLLAPQRRPKLLLLWLALFPIGAALNRETPSATRSISGALLFPVLAGVGLGYAWRLLLRTGWRRTAAFAVGLALAASLRFLVPETAAYLRHYLRDYPSYSAAGIYGFQYGWRELFGVLEERRPTVDRALITTSDMNQPYIFRLFYVDRTAEEIARWGQPRFDYRHVAPADVSRWYDPRKDLLYAVRPFDMWIFDSWQERTDIVAPGGHVAFAVLRNPVPRDFIDRWQAVGPFPNPQNRNRRKDFIDAGEASRGAGRSDWTPVPAAHGFVKLNSFMGRRSVPPTNNAEFQIAYLRTRIQAPQAENATLEVFGSGDEVAAWVNGVRVSDADRRTIVEPTKPARIPIRLESGENVLLIKTIETVGNWWIAAEVK